MADVTGWNRNGGIFWIRDTSDEDQPVVFVPGVSREKIMGMKEGSRCGLDRKGKMKPSKVDRNAVAGSSAKRKLCVAPEHKAKGSPVYATPSAMSAVQSRADSRFLPPAVPSTELAEADQAKSRACLKDLCPEDKRRIANLIQELARVTEEKDETMQRLHDEQESFERKIQQLEEQNQLIVQERQSLQQQYRECQELLSLYQQYLSQEHEKLSQSCSQRKVSTDEFVPAGPRRPGGHDCSYLGLSNHDAVKGDGQRSSRTDTPTQHPASSYQPSDPAERASQVTGPQGVRQGPQHPGTFKCAGSVTVDSRSTKEMCGSFCSPCEMRLEDGGPSSSEVAATAPPAGQEDWKERRNRLLLQKMELEVERERLQACLTQQEERLLQQRQRLRQSRLEHSRLPDVPVGGSDSVSNGLELQKQNTPRGDLSCQVDVRVLPVGTAGQPATDKGAMSHPLDQSLHSGGAVTLPTEHAAPSTVESSVQLQSVPSAVDKTPRSRSLRITQPCSVDSTLIELLEVMSPISGRDYTGFLTQQRLKPPFIASGVRGMPASASFVPPPSPQHSMQEDPEESQLLEEIFFIC
ncbi:protein hinderin isoform X2 [Brienomyrus brachyistius]|uniref:protein hinderin isoform X2 n=1 Tax=Brienomyrus brachyistius TaxID=42636 RepID=UPI0020B3E03F|nr:protein hinderin isoform X2 [Brienomyrus brachyistius]